MRVKRIVAGALALLLTIAVLPPTPVTQAQEGEASCPAIVQLAIDTTHESCDETGLNRACYGHLLIDARARANVEDFTFIQPGDQADLLALESLRLSNMDPINGVWGIALMRLQAHMLYAAPREVMLLLFGDVEMENAVEPPALAPVTVGGSGFVNVRLRPSVRAGVVGTLAAGQMVTANGRLEDDSWVRVALPDSGRVGWLSAELLADLEPLAALDVVEADSVYYGPMQAFYLQTGENTASLCPEAPPNGLLIQTPEGMAEVNLLLNEVNIQLRATAFVDARPGGAMRITVLEGWAQVEANGITQTAYGGSAITVPLGGNLAPLGAPSAPHPYDPDLNLGALPLTVLGSPITLASPLTQAGIDALVSAANSSTTAPASTTTTSDVPLTTDPVVEPLPATDGGSAPATTTSGGGTTTADAPPASSEPAADEGAPSSPPGLEGVVPPGQGGTPPGQGGTPPGQAKQD